MSLSKVEVNLITIPLQIRASKCRTRLVSKMNVI
jgi:hypothetical protein